jgi:hypothetical protein
MRRAMILIVGVGAGSVCDLSVSSRIMLVSSSRGSGPSKATLSRWTRSRTLPATATLLQARCTPRSRIFSRSRSRMRQNMPLLRAHCHSHSSRHRSYSDSVRLYPGRLQSQAGQCAGRAWQPQPGPRGADRSRVGQHFGGETYPGALALRLALR